MLLLSSGAKVTAKHRVTEVFAASNEICREAAFPQLVKRRKGSRLSFSSTPGFSSVGAVAYR